MRIRLILWRALTTFHCLALAFPPDLLAPVLAGSVYLAVLIMQALGLRVFAAAPTGGWASPMWPGWIAVAIFWALIWWSVVAQYRENVGIALPARQIPPRRTVSGA